MNPTQNQAQTPAPPVAITPADILRGAARYLELHGWIQADPFGRTPDGGIFPLACVSGAMTMAVYGRPTDPDDPRNNDSESAEQYHRALRCLADALWADGRVAEQELSAPVYMSANQVVTDWNDEAGQTTADVTAFLNAAADDYDWAHATEDDLETYADACVWNEKRPDREGFLAWRAAQ